MTAPSLRVLGLSGSLRAKSYNTAALRAAAELAPDGMTVEIADISTLPFFNEDVEKQGYPDPVAKLQALSGAADAVLIATPEYNSGLPGALKNALDWLSRPPGKALILGKPTAILGCSPGALGSGRAQMELRNVAAGMGMHVLPGPQVMIAQAHTRFDADGRLTDETTRKFVAALMAALADWTRRLRPHS